MIDRYRIDTDFMLECVTDSFARIGDPQAVRLVRAAFPNESWGFRNFSSALLGDIKHQESEDALLALLESEPDPSIRTMLCIGLCRLFSESGVEKVLGEIARGYDRSIDIL
jgi:HEAT repeat protein